jgi:hypothetical protein
MYSWNDFTFRAVGLAMLVSTPVNDGVLVMLVSTPVKDGVLVMLVSTPVKDGVLTERSFQALYAKNIFSGVSFMVLQSQFINIGSLRFVIILLKQISSEDFRSKS